ncbi:hypothetical protein QWY85_01240 [Neolewinella lacunae]|uniref:SPOR domain-containing protein n=1 Tax=Neolewinella lacunae TaxID=1517758 RepID=A0A923PP98_9BACT|nr:hypothetical protein [Neolewinella lacunae]MBC6994969.1 hypothetical protein [Neolewinella lacunae]MDN3633260.1 hypothetical protein [Neolewinella lacunae]
MPRLFSFLLLCSFALLAVSCSPKTTAAAGEGGVDWAARAAEYKRNPDALRQLVEDCETSQQQLITTRTQLEQMRNQGSSSDQALTAARNDAANARNEAAAAIAQVNQLQQQLAQERASRNDQVDTDRNTVAGVIFQVQLGAFAQNTVDPSMATDNALELQEQNGLQKFVVSQFRTYANAVQLRDRLRQMGVKDAFVVARNNGTRIDVQEAIRLAGQN